MRAGRRQRTAVWILSALVCLLGFFRVAGETPSKADIAVVVHPDTPVSTLSLNDLRKVFLGQRQYWNKNIPVVLFIHPPTTLERDMALKVLYEMTERRFKQYWMAMVFRGVTVTPPKTISSNNGANQLVAAIPGAIALIKVDDVALGLKVLRVDGRLPGEPRYPLR